MNLLFRSNHVYLAFMFDFGEKLEMYRSPRSGFIPDGVCEEDVEDYSLMSEKSATGYENSCRNDLNRGRWAVA